MKAGGEVFKVCYEELTACFPVAAFFVKNVDYNLDQKIIFLQIWPFLVIKILKSQKFGMTWPKNNFQAVSRKF